MLMGDLNNKLMDVFTPEDLCSGVSVDVYFNLKFDFLENTSPGLDNAVSDVVWNL